MSDSIFFRFVRDGEDVIAIRSDAIQSVTSTLLGYNFEIRIIHSGGKEFIVSSRSRIPLERMKEIYSIITSKQFNDVVIDLSV